MAKIDVIMPQMGESIAEGTLSRWLKKVGDAVKRDEPIFEISTDKVDAEIPAPVAGVLAEILVTEGQTVAVQTVVAPIETEAGAAVAPAAAARAASRRRAAPPAAAAAPAAAEPRRPAAPARRDRGRPGAGRRRAEPSRAAADAQPAADAGANGGERDRRGAPPPEVHPAGPEDGGRAQPRSERHSRAAASRAASPRTTS